MFETSRWRRCRWCDTPLKAQQEQICPACQGEGIKRCRFCSEPTPADGLVFPICDSCYECQEWMRQAHAADHGRQSHPLAEERIALYAARAAAGQEVFATRRERLPVTPQRPAMYRHPC